MKKNLILLVTLFLLAGCQVSTPISDQQDFTCPQDSDCNLWATTNNRVISPQDPFAGNVKGTFKVIDENYQPLSQATVFLLPARLICTTDDTGQCSITNIKPISFRISARRQNYEHYELYDTADKFTEPENFRVIQMTKLKNPQPTQTFKGKIVKLTVHKGTESENNYFMIQQANGQQDYLFNNIGKNLGFDDYLDKNVVLTGYRDIGIIGWEQKEVEGIYVQGIK